MQTYSWPSQCEQSYPSFHPSFSSINLSNLLLNFAIVSALTILLLGMFQSSTTSMENLFLPISHVNLNFSSLNPLIIRTSVVDPRSSSHSLSILCPTITQSVRRHSQGHNHCHQLFDTFRHTRTPFSTCFVAPSPVLLLRILPL